MYFSRILKTIHWIQQNILSVKLNLQDRHSPCVIYKLHVWQVILTRISCTPNNPHSALKLRISGCVPGVWQMCFPYRGTQNEPWKQFAKTWKELERREFLVNVMYVWGKAFYYPHFHCRFQSKRLKSTHIQIHIYSRLFWSIVLL